jgi:cellulose synthase/poly-beta-1,6-N-acetylglucosamine synthase-like glycosyltransferase
VIDEVSSVRLVLAVTFWGAVCGVLYPYFAYPLLLWLLGGRRRERVTTDETELPSVTMIVPVHNEASRLLRKIENTAALSYPAEKLEVLFVSDGSTDDTVDLARAHLTPSMTVIPLPVRRGKAAALNAGLAHARHDVLVFTDASIELEPDSLRRLVARFADPEIGCVSGEDRIAGSGGEAWYGRYELMLRRLESQVHSIVGASGSFYAQRRALCAPFTEGQAPDFLSVLRTVEQGKRAVTAPDAVGAMTSLKDPRQEFERKVRTLIRGMTTLFAHAHLLNPLQYGRFSFVLFSHKVMRWLAPVFLVVMLGAPLGLLPSPFYLAAFAAQSLFYLLALAALWQLGGLNRLFVGKLALYFSSVNMAILVAWVRYGRGVRQELWTPSHR